MIIQASNTNFQTKHSYQSSSLSMQTVESLPASAEEEKTATTSGFGQNLSDVLERYQNTQRVKASTLQERIAALNEIRSQTINYLLQMLFGKRVTTASDLSGLSSSNDTASTATDTGSTDYTMQTTRYTSYFIHHEDETTEFNAKGSVVTADGRSIDFSIGLSMSRSFTEAASEYIDFTQPVLCDPLVINLDTGFAGVSDQQFFFDLDCDGTEEEISQLSSGSGFLALDQNEDGVINDGSELFGTASGNGFADLAKYDEDGNGWIDEADSIFQKLKIWVKDENGNDQLYSLKDAGVGALYLGSSSTPFSLTDAANNTNAVIRQTGLFLYENGNAGTMQQLDLAT
jgi:hypothetical protein